MKLNVKRTILVGFAFFLISAFWQSYDKIVPLILTYRFGMNQTLSGFIMSLDNIFAVFMLPIFGAISDRYSSRLGKRTPFILVGTCAAIVCYVLLGLTHSLALFILVLLALLFSMAIFRSPAVALMPDVTVKPLRSKGNAIINLCGTAGGIIILGFGLFIKVDADNIGNTLPYIFAVSSVMLAALLVFLFTVKEPLWAKEAADAAPVGEGETKGTERHTLSREERVSLWLILASVALWFIGYNAVTSKFSVYVGEAFGGTTSYDLSLIVAQAAAIAAYIPVGFISSKIGRKKTILAGIGMLTAAFGAAAFLNAQTPAVLMYLLFALAGIGWATINVNSFPMAVELADAKDVGKFTGFYYTASMAAQIFTPIFSGLLIDLVGWQIFFPYAALFVALSGVTMFFVRHGDAKPPVPEDLLEEFAGGDD